MTAPESGQTKPAPSRGKRLGRGLFRCARTTLVVVLLLAAALGLFLNKVGLPEFVKERVIAQARAKGLEVQFSRLRLRWYRGIVAENLHVQGTNSMAGPQLFVHALRQFHIHRSYFSNRRVLYSHCLAECDRRFQRPNKQ